MFAQSRPHAPAIGHSACRFLATLALCLALLAGCSSAPPPAGPHPADPQARSRPAAYRPVIGPYTSERPLEPSGWRENNERVAPKEKP
jgi:hypothetical protein